MRQVLLGLFVFVFVELSSATLVYKPLSMAFEDLPAKSGNFQYCLVIQFSFVFSS